MGVAVMNRIVDANRRECANGSYGCSDFSACRPNSPRCVCFESPGWCEAKSAKKKNEQYGFGRERQETSFPEERIGAPERVGLLNAASRRLSKKFFECRRDHPEFERSLAALLDF
jgi:hypothetical protein